MAYGKKLKVALPLDAINAASTGSAPIAECGMGNADWGLRNADC